MEEIILKNIELKADKNGKKMAVISFNGNRKASIGSWLENEVNFFEKECGIGDRIQVELSQKGDYLNITSVNYPTLIKNKAEVVLPEMPKVPVASIKDNSIIAQVIIKEANKHIGDLAMAGTIIGDDHYEEMLVTYSKNLAKAYRFAFSELEK